jgi:hypothetical protein
MGIKTALANKGWCCSLVTVKQVTTAQETLSQPRTAIKPATAALTLIMNTSSTFGQQ